MTQFSFLWTALAVVSVSVFDKSANAYLDPNIGSMLLQGTIAGIAVVSVTVRMYWYRLRAFFKGEKLDMEEDLLAGLEPKSEEKTE